MTLELAIRLTEIMLALAFLQQSFEHIASRGECGLFLPRILLSILLVAGFQTPWISLALLIHALFVLGRFHGPYNGGSDRISLLILCCLCLAHFMPGVQLQEYVFGYLALQLILSYFMAGWVKIRNPEWRNGLALQDVFRFSAYPASEDLRKWAKKPSQLLAASWAVMLFELAFPAVLLNQTCLVIGLILAASFHLANACLFGLNRFLWSWLAAYPSLLWLQERIFN